MSGDSACFVSELEGGEEVGVVPGQYLESRGWKGKLHYKGCKGDSRPVNGTHENATCMKWVLGGWSSGR